MVIWSNSRKQIVQLILNQNSTKKLILTSYPNLVQKQTKSYSLWKGIISNKTRLANTAQVEVTTVVSLKRLI